MFPFSEAFQGFMLAIYALETYIILRQYSNLKIKERPPQLEGVVTQEKFTKSQAYGRANERFDLVSSTVSTIHSLFVLRYGLMPLLWTYCGIWLDHFGLPRDDQILRAIIYMIVSTVYNFVIQLPFTLYNTFVLEESFGFNKQTWKLWVTDQLKSFALLIVIGVPLLVAALKVIEWGGENFWIYLWLFTVTISFVMLTIYPTLIAPLFNKFTELEDGEVRTAIYELAKKNDFPLTKLYVVDGSARSAHSNAYFYGFFKNKRIVIYDTLLKQVDKEELVAILGHELGHWKMRHTVINLIIAFTYYLIFCFILGKTLHTPDMFSSFGFDQPSIFIGMTLFSYIYSPVEHFFSFVMHIISRAFEYQADTFAVNQGYGNQLKTSLIKISEENLSMLSMQT
ncbi:hypothetical protein PROFUN_03291 [Planoprotostelium fungivorum]|uniref:CAAX prenyl protease n=1 Tax=Planoprotostelium fungivorum TaxID=1890364 RepID=A0A2P6NWN8_9EUKA|nr:hypothetical protein PROFUN_03291 [Planoprotostelium fungivorum]